MNQELFVEERVREWDDFHYILKILESQGIKALSVEQLERFTTLYREVTGDLMYAKSHGFDPKIVAHLNALVARGHPHVYSPPPGTTIGILGFLTDEFPEVVRRHFRLLLLAVAIFTLGFLVADLTILVTPHNADLFLPEEMLASLNDRLAKDTTTGWAASPNESASNYPFVSSFIVTNNIRVGFLSFVYGIAFGLGTAWILFQNGLLIGAYAGLFANHHLALRYWALVLPHGVIELVAIFICAQAGLLLGRALLIPGRYRRRDAFAVAGNAAVRLVLGTLVLFAAAALIEGFVTPLPLPDTVKLGVALATAAGLYLYFRPLQAPRLLR